MIKRTVAFFASLFGVSASGQAAQIDNRAHATQVTTLQPEERVNAFIAAFHRAHSQLMAEKGNTDFERWTTLVNALDEAHFLDHGGRELAGVIDGESPHTLEREPIVSVTRADDRVFVETRVEDKYLPTFYEYELREANAGDWRIVRLREFRDPPDALFMTAKEKPRFDNPTIHPLRQLSAEEAAVDGDKLFTSGRSVKLDDKVSSIKVCTVGTLSVTTGVLVVGDLGYGPYTLSPVGQRVPPGKYTVEVAVAFERNAALRIRFSEEKVAAWHPADMGDGGHGVGVDAGNVAIMDLAAIITLNARDKERAFDIYAREAQPPNARMMSLVGTNDAVIADSGWGDGRYPVYWGVDANGKAVVLLVDFLLLPES